ncbi:MAG: SIR2 family NAD-dependent protein deacylase [Ignavibacteriales bacterium]
MDTKNLDQIVGLMARSKNTVVVTGAGISTEAGIPDFRGEKGIYRELGEQAVMNIINIDAFRKSPETFYKFYRQHFTFPLVEPSKAHFMLADLEKRGFVKAIVTQNIDNLHQRAGSKRVIPIHGNAESFVCTGRGCQMTYDTAYVQDFPAIVPTCAKCGGVVKPDVVLFGEQIKNYLDAQETILEARLLIVIGSSLTVWPLAGFVKEFSTFTQDLVIINKGYTAMDHAAVAKLEVTSTGEALEEIGHKLYPLKRQ